MRGIFIRLLLTLQLVFLVPARAPAYSVLTHEAIIDSVWDSTFKGVLLKRFPKATPAELLQAHAYAYGGAIIQDMGYYPFGNKYFTDLVHYVRSGDFVINLLNDAQNLNEYAFALGAMAHYWADGTGHPEGVNIVEPLLYRKIQRKYGHNVTYEQNPAAHLKTEFGFDVLEVAHGNYAPQAYHDFIGFKVAKPVLERSFEHTYDIPLSDIFKDLDLALGAYRRTASKLIPEMTKVGWSAYKDEIQKTRPGITAREFRYRLSRAEYNKEWTNKDDRPGSGAGILAFVFKLMPPVGPFKTLRFKMPTPECEAVFMRSFNDTLERVRSSAAGLPAGRVQLSNLNFDTGAPTRQGQYRKADETYARLLAMYAAKQVQPSEPMRANIIAFYEDPLQIRDPEALLELNVLKSAKPPALSETKPARAPRTPSQSKGRLP